MSLQDFLTKEWRIAREEGLTPALQTGLGEATMKAAKPYASARSTPIWTADWDVCLVLDACRADTFASVAGDRWDHTTAWSVGSASPEWLSNTFADRHQTEWRRAGYVTANPFSGKQGDEVGALDEDVFPLQTRGLAYLDEVWRDQWGDELPTVDAATMTDRGLWAWTNRERFGIDRLVVHYMQPHIPFRARPEWTDGWDLNGFGTGGGRGKDDWHKLRDGDVDADAFWRAYEDNLRWVLGEVGRWRKLTDADLLVTSDHGNAAGEWGQWGHPPESANPALRRVPWVEMTDEGTTTADPDPPGDPPVVGETTDERVTDRLQALGYHD